MIIYIITFLFTIVFTILCEYELKKHRKKRPVLFSAIAVFIPCIIAGLRAPGVGIDSGTYAYTDFLIALRSCNFSSYYLHSAVKEILYPIIVYVSSRISDHFFVLYFFSQLLINGPVYIALFMIKRERKDFSIVISYAAFLFLYYNLSLSVIRQSMATSYIILGYTIYKITKKYNIKTILLYACAALTHTFALAIIASIVILDRIINDTRKELWKKALIIFVIIAAIANVNRILVLASSLLPGIMTKYINTFNYLDVSGLSYGDTLMKVVFFLMCVTATYKNTQNRNIDIARKESNGNVLSLKNYTFFGAIGILFQFISIISEYLVRISYYYQFFMIIPIGVFYTAFTKKERPLMKIVSVLLLFMYWYIVYASWNWHGTMPFEFATY